jgi:Fic family protein
VASFLSEIAATAKKRGSKKKDRARASDPWRSAGTLGAELCRERGRITVAEAEKATGANRSTIKDHLKALTRAGHIAQHGAGRGAWYGLA